MEGVWITKNGFRATRWNGEIQQYVDKPIRHIFHELRGACQIEDGVTLGNIIAAVANDKALCALIGQYSWCDPRAFYSELNKPTTAKSGLRCIELCRLTEMHEPTSPGKEGDCDSWIDVQGRDADTEQGYAIELTPVNELAEIPVLLNPMHVIRRWNSEGISDIGKGNTSFSLLEVLGEIFYEISFFGSPEDRGEMASELAEIFREVKAGEVELIPWNTGEGPIQ